MGKYVENESLDVMITAIVEKKLTEYKEKLKKDIKKHFDNPYCAKTDIGSVIYEKEIMELINRI